MGNSNTDEYFVFISYSGKDEKLAKWLQDELEDYNLPTLLNGKARPNLRKVFRDRTELSAGELGPQIERSLQDSTHLVVVCSPNSAKSEWVDKEIRAFIRLHNIKFDGTDVNKILPFIIEGNSPDEYFPATLISLKENGIDLLGGDINKDNGTDAAFIKIVAGLLNLPYDKLFDRYARKKAEAELRERERKENLQRSQSFFLSERSLTLTREGNPFKGVLYALEALPKNIELPERPVIQDAVNALYQSVFFEYGKLNKEFDYIKYKKSIFICNGKWLISCSDKDLFVWDYKTGEKIKQWPGHSEIITDIICVGAGKNERVVSTAQDGYLKIWNLNGVCEKETPIENSWDLSIASIGDVVVAANANWTIDVYSVKGELLKPGREKLHKGTITAIDCNEKYIVTGSFDKTVAVWDLQTLNLITTPQLKTVKDSVSVVKIYSDYLIVGTDNLIQIFNTATWKKISIIEDSDENHGNVTAVIRNKGFIIAGYEDGIIIVWNIKGTFSCKCKLLVGSGKKICSISFNGRYLSVCSQDGDVYLFIVHCAKLFNIAKRKGNVEEIMWINNYEAETFGMISNFK